MDVGTVRARLAFAKTRLGELLDLNGGKLGGAKADDRDRLTMEFLFHAVGATEFLAQLVNERCALGLPAWKVRVWKVAAMLKPHPAAAVLQSLYVDPAGPFPAEPYTDDAVIYRLLNYRHQANHRGRNPFLVRVTFGGAPEPPFSLILDPRDAVRGHSERPIQEDLTRTLTLVTTRCEKVLELLGLGGTPP